MSGASNSSGRRRRTAILAASALGHAVALALLGLAAPPRPWTGRDEPDVTPVVIWTPLPATTASRRPRRASAPSPVTPRAPRAAARPAAVSPLPLAPTPGPPRAALQAGAGDHPAPLPLPSRGDLRSALRGSPVGCANRDIVGLTLREREACDDAYAKGRKDAAVIAAPIEPGKRAAWDAEAARRERIRRRKAAPPPPGVDPSNNAGGTKTNGIGILDY